MARKEARNRALVQTSLLPLIKVNAPPSFIFPQIRTPTSAK